MHWIIKKKWNLCYFFMMVQTSSVIATGRLCKVSHQRDGCGNLGWLWNCSHLNFGRIPLDFNTMLKGKSISIDLSSNNFTSISPETFAGIRTTVLKNITALHMQNNAIKCIDKFSFRRLSRLCVLDLSSCNLQISTLSQCAFSYLTKLEILYIQGNKFNKFNNESHNYSYPEVELSRLSSLNELHIDVFKGFRFRNNFTRLKHLNKLTLHPTNSVFHLYNNTFSGLSESPIYSLTMNFKNHVRCNVSEDILCSFPFLNQTEMNFGGECDLNPVLRALKCLQNRTIAQISARKNFPFFVKQWFSLDKNNCKYLLNICVQKVDFSNNRITDINVDFLETQFGRCIEYLDLSKNRITHFEPSILIHFFKSYPNLHHFDISVVKNRKSVNVLMSNRSILNLNITFTLSNVLEVLRFSNNYIPDMNVPFQFHLKIVGKALKKLDMSNTNFPCNKIMQMYFPLLEVLDISGNNCQHISISKTLTNLKILRASNIEFGYIADESQTSLLYGLQKLQQLDLQNNFIRHLPSTIFQEQTTLNTLYLDGNNLSSIPTAVGHLRNLKHLYIRRNKFTSLKKSDFQILQSLKNVRIFIKGNILYCDCNHISSLRQMKNNQDLFGDLNETLCSEFSILFSELFHVRRFAIFEKKCQSGMWLISSSFMLFFVTIGMVVAIAIKRYRVHVDYVILRLRNRWKGVINADESETFQFDAFISYSEDDYHLVCTTMYQALTNLGFQISFPEKDFIPGVWKADQVVQYIDNSRKVVFVVTENFLDNGWDSYAVQMAVTHAFHNLQKRSIIVVVKDNIPLERLPKTLLYIWWRIFSIRWPDTEERHAMDSFWENFSAALR